MSFTPITGYCIASEARYGSNGASGSVPEVTVGRSPSSQSTGRKVWDPNWEGGFSSGWVDFKLTLLAGGGAGGVSWDVQGGATHLMYSDAQYGTITEVRIRAGVNGANRRVSFKDLFLDFYADNQTIDPDEAWELPSTDWPVADTTGQEDPVDDEKILVFQPDGSELGKVVVRGFFKLESTEGAGIPEATDLFAQIYVFTSQCS